MSDKLFYARNGLQVAANTRFVLPSGTTTQRPSSPVNGDLRFNTDLGAYESYYAANTTWAPPVTVSIGGNQTFSTVTVGNSTVNSFANSTGFQFQDTGGVRAILNTTSLSLSNSTVSTNVQIGTIAMGNTVVNTTSVGIGNSTVSLVANSTQLTVGGATLNSTALKIGATTLNATNYGGSSLLANNSSFLGGVAAASYVQSSALSAYQTTAGLSTAVSGLSCNNAAFLGGVAAAGYWTTSSLVNVSQLTNNAGYITGLSAAAAYSVNTITATTYLYSSGNIYAVGDVYAAYSDARLKDIKDTISSPLEKVDALRGVYYTRNDVAPEIGDINDKRLMVGLIAQDIEKVLPEVVSYILDKDGNETEYKTVQYARVVPLLVEAIKELRAEVAWLRQVMKI